MTDDRKQWQAGGDAVRSHHATLSPVADEYRVKFASDGIHVDVLDPANVLMVETRLDPGITGEYDLGGDVPAFGMNDAVYKKAVSGAKKGRGDDPGTLVRFSFDQGRRRLSITYEEETQGQPVIYSTKFSTLDPGSLRDDPGKPSLDLPVSGTVNRSAIVSALDRVIGSSAEMVTLTATEDGSLDIERNGDSADQTAELPSVASTDSGRIESIYSSDYLRQIKNGLAGMKSETVSFRFGSEFPIIVSASRPEVGLEVTYTLAPRIAPE